MHTVRSETKHYPKESKLTDHSLMPPCQAACPLYMDIREYVDLVAQGKIMEALQVIRSTNPFPSICAYVCTHACEDACRRCQVDSAVSIKAIKRFALEFGGDRMIQTEAKTTHAEKVAIVGSGPAGLACAYYLRTMGYEVTVFEAHSEIGGMLRVGIPQYRLPREVLDVEEKRLIQMGVEIRTSTRVVSLDLLFEMGYKAVFITIGAHQSLRLGIEGEESAGVIDGATFLREVNLGLKPSLGNSVAIVGGGNVAIDAARTALRLGSSDVTILYRRTRAEMPAADIEISQAEEEGINIEFLVAPVKVDRKNDQLAVTCIRMELGESDEQGRRRPINIDGSEFNISFDSLITAIGQIPHNAVEFGVRTARGSTIQVDPQTLITNKVGVFAGGDAVTGPATVVEALAAGKRASQRIDDYAQHRYPLDKNGTATMNGELSQHTVEKIRKIERLEPPVTSSKKRAKDFEPIEQVYNWQSATSEARRCLRCGMGAEILFQDKCASCLTCLRICPYDVPYVDNSGTVIIPPEQCQACGICIAECPAKAIVMRKPSSYLHINEELEHAIKSFSKSEFKPSIIGFCCQYGLFGTGTLANLWRGAKAGIWIVPVLCVAKIAPGHILRAFELGAEGVFIAGCGEQCARENTNMWIGQRSAKVRKTLGKIGLEQERLAIFNTGGQNEELTAKLDEFTETISTLFLTSVIMQEVKR
ncbi:FAD-dependent oxidoreductase [Chloroflexota bacterium]